jgi:hypothetical protein
MPIARRGTQRTNTGELDTMPPKDDSAQRPGATRPGASRPVDRALLGRAEERINDALQDTADRIQAAADRLGHFAGQRFSGTEGAMGRAGDLAHSLADSLERAAEQVRISDLDVVRTTIEQRGRAHPLQTLLVGVAAGWLVGKIVR